MVEKKLSKGQEIPYSFFLLTEGEHSAIMFVIIKKRRC
jgi:hypothetical protein